jgi:hypothetical protein
MISERRWTFKRTSTETIRSGRLRMAYTADSIPKDHGEFSGGGGLIDAELRKDRVLTPDELRMEIMFTNPDPPGSAALGGYAGPLTLNDREAEEAFAKRSKAIELENDPETVPLPRIQGLPVEAE